MPAHRRDELVWKRSSRCDAGACVEVSAADEAVAVRDSKLADSPILWFSSAGWTAFLDALKAGEFDLR